MKIFILNDRKGCVLYLKASTAFFFAAKSEEPFHIGDSISSQFVSGSINRFVLLPKDTSAEYD